MAGILDQQYWPTFTSGQVLRYAATTQVKIGMGFIPTVTKAIQEVHLALFKANSPSGNVFVQIFNDSAGKPGTQVGGDSSNVNCSTITSTTDSSPDEITFTWASNAPSLTASTQYWIVLAGDYTPSSTVFAAWSLTTAGGGYAGGDMASYDGTNWANNTNYETGFREYYQSDAGAFLAFM